jgi:hypothetical protein
MDQVNCGEGDLCAPHAAPAASPAEIDNARPCLVTAGMKRAQLYASQCTAVTSADNADCNPESACGLMIDDIKAGCAALAGAAPGFCSTYLGEANANP